MQHIFRRFLAAALVFAMFATLLSSCAGKNTITVYSEGDYLDPSVLAAFTEETGIKVNYITGNRTPSPEERAAQIDDRAQTEGNADPNYTSADAVFSAKAAAEQTPYAGMSLREILLSSRRAKNNEALSLTAGNAAAYADTDPEHTAAMALTDGDADYNAKEVKKYQEPAYDVVLTDADTLLELSDSGLLLPLSETDIPNLANINSDWRDTANHPERSYSAMCLWETVGLLWNTEIVNEQQKSWQTLWNETYSGQILMPNQQRDCLSVALSALGYDPNSSDPAEIAAAFEKLSGQRSLVRAYTDGEAYALMERGYAALMPCGSGDALAIMQLNPSLAYMIPAEGSFRISFGYGVTTDSRKADKAKQFVDYMCSVTNLAKNAVYSKYSVTSDEAVTRLDISWQSNPLAYPPANITAVSPVLIGRTPEARALSAQQWAKLTAVPDAETPSEKSE